MNTLMPLDQPPSTVQATLRTDQEQNLMLWEFMNRGIKAQRAVDDITSNYHKGDPESVAANRRVNKARQTKRVLEALAALKGATSEEVENNTGLPHQSVSARMSELKRAGLIVKIGLRKTSSGCWAGVYKVT